MTQSKIAQSKIDGDRVVVIASGRSTVDEARAAIADIYSLEVSADDLIQQWSKDGCDWFEFAIA